MKYVMFQITTGDLVRHVPVIFPDTLVHSDVAGLLLALPQLTGASIVSAGECRVDSIACYGQSKTLQVTSLERTDADTIEMYPYLHGIYDAAAYQLIKDAIENSHLIEE